MSLIKRLLVIVAGFFAAHYVLGISPMFSPQQPDVWGNAFLSAGTMQMVYLAAAVLTVLTVIESVWNMLKDRRSAHVSYARIIWTMTLLIVDVALFGMWFKPNMQGLLAWVLLEPLPVQIVVGAIVFPSALLVVKIFAMIGVAVDAYNEPANESDGVLDAILQLEGRLDLMCMQIGLSKSEQGRWTRPPFNLNQKLSLTLESLGCTPNEKNEWDAPGTLLNDKLVLFLESYGFIYNEPEGTWATPKDFGFKHVHGRIDGLFAHLKRIEGDVAGLTNQSTHADNDTSHADQPAHNLKVAS